MKAKLLKKIRARYTMTYNPNFINYSYKLTVRYRRFDLSEIASETYMSKEQMFDAYRSSVITYCGKLYGCYKQPKAQKSIQTIKHCEKINL